MALITSNCGIRCGQLDQIMIYFAKAGMVRPHGKAAFKAAFKALKAFIHCSKLPFLSKTLKKLFLAVLQGTHYNPADNSIK